MKTYFIIAVVAVATVGTARCQTPPGNAATAPASAPAANPSPPPSAPAKLGAAELEKLVQPIALHPDPLIAIILPASVYPLEIVQAARFVKDTNNIPKVDEQPWDDNVKELAKFPDMIAKMDTDLTWTTELGQAFVDQPKEVMDMIQTLRGKAKKAGTLQTTKEQIVTVTNMVVVQTNMTQVVTVTNEIVQVQPSNPQVVYVPSYPPTVYYPPPAYVYNPYAPLVTFGVGMAWGAILANNCNWGYGHVDVDIDRNVNRNVNRNTDRNTQRSGNRASTTGTQKQWKPDQNRMRSSGATTASSRDARGWGSGTSQRPTASTGARPSTGTAATRPSTGTANQRPSTGTAASRPTTGTAPSSRPSTAQAPNRSQQNSAFSGVNSGSSARSSSSRGASSRSGGFSGGSRGGGGGGRGGGGRGR
jgi:hypothetical protein